MQDFKKIKVGALTFDALSFAVGYEAGKQKQERGISSDFIVTVATTDKAGPKPKEGETALDRKADLQ